MGWGVRGWGRVNVLADHLCLFFWFSGNEVFTVEYSWICGRCGYLDGRTDMVADKYMVEELIASGGDIPLAESPSESYILFKRYYGASLKDICKR